MKNYEFWQTSEEEKYAARRIPGMIVTKKGDVIVYNEARTALSDWAMMDIVMRISHDGGEHFGEDVVLAQGTREHPTVNNPVMVEDKSGRIHFLYCEDYATCGGRVLHRVSNDGGETFSPPRDISDATRPDWRNAFALGPGHGICLSSGRLLIPVWAVPKSFRSPIREHSPSVVSALYSDDGGESWQMGDSIPSSDRILSPNETAAAECEDGSVYFSLRQQAFHRVKAISRNGGASFAEVAPEYALTDPQCFGSLALWKKPYTLLFANCESMEGRTHVCVKGSLDGGKTWAKRLMIDECHGGYVEIAADEGRERIYVLYEEDWGRRLHFVTFAYSELLPL